MQGKVTQPTRQAEKITEEEGEKAGTTEEPAVTDREHKKMAP